MALGRGRWSRERVTAALILGKAIDAIFNIVTESGVRHGRPGWRFLRGWGYFLEFLADPLTCDLSPWVTTQVILRSPWAQVPSPGVRYST